MQLTSAVRDLYPFKSHFYALQNGHRLHYIDEGPAEAETLVMVHGNPTWSFYYRDLVKGLRDRYRCVAVDHIGCGLSDKPQDWGYTIEEHADNLVELVEALGLENVTLVVHDWGGPIGYLAALKLGDRFKRFVVFNTGVFLQPVPAMLKLIKIPGYGALMVRGLNGMLHGGVRMITAKPERIRGAVREGYFAPYDSWANRVALLRFVQEIPLEAEHRNRKLLDSVADRIAALSEFPHLVMWGLKDWVFHPGYLKEWRERFPDAEVHEFEDVSHWVVEEAHERILPVMKDFLGRTV